MRQSVRMTAGRAWILVFPMLACLGFAMWYVEAGDFSERAVSGRYGLQTVDRTSRLVLMRDHTFQQEIDFQGKTARSAGTWRIVGEGGIAFSKDFIVVPGQERSHDGTVYGQIKNVLGIVSIRFDQDSDGLEFRKRIFR
jgi:hypothetical protein